MDFPAAARCCPSMASPSRACCWPSPFTWRRSGWSRSCSACSFLRGCRHEVSLPYPTELEFTVEEDEMRERPFVHLAELAAEGWVKAASRWHQLTGIPVRFDADTTLIRRRSIRRKAEFPQEPAAV